MMRRLALAALIIAIVSTGCAGAKHSGWDHPACFLYVVLTIDPPAFVVVDSPAPANPDWKLLVDSREREYCEGIRAYLDSGGDPAVDVYLRTKG